MSDNATSPEIHESSNILGLTAQIVSAHVVKNRVDADALSSDPVGLSLSFDSGDARSCAAGANTRRADQEVSVPGLPCLP